MVGRIGQVCAAVPGFIGISSQLWEPKQHELMCLMSGTLYKAMDAKSNQTWTGKKLQHSLSFFITSSISHCILRSCGCTILIGDTKKIRAPLSCLSNHHFRLLNPTPFAQSCATKVAIVRMCVHAYRYIYMNMHPSTHTHRLSICMYACMHGCMDVWNCMELYGIVWNCMDVWMYGCMYVCMFVCICFSNA